MYQTSKIALSVLENAKSETSSGTQESAQTYHIDKSYTENSCPVWSNWVKHSFIISSEWTRYVSNVFIRCTCFEQYDHKKLHHSQTLWKHVSQMTRCQASCPKEWVAQLRVWKNAHAVKHLRVEHWHSIETIRVDAVAWDVLSDECCNGWDMTLGWLTTIDTPMRNPEPCWRLSHACSRGEWLYLCIAFCEELHVHKCVVQVCVLSSLPVGCLEIYLQANRNWS